MVDRIAPLGSFAFDYALHWLCLDFYLNFPADSFTVGLRASFAVFGVLPGLSCGELHGRASSTFLQVLLGSRLLHPADFGRARAHFAALLLGGLPHPS